MDHINTNGILDEFNDAEFYEGLIANNVLSIEN